jgi:uncharacterized membrane protein
MRKQLICLAVAGIVIAGCKKEEEDKGCVSTYNATVAPIINARCGVSGCHNGSSSLVDLTVYENLKARIDNGLVQTNVFELKLMPPASSTQLTEDEKAKIKCWMDNGAHQN